MTCKHVTLQVEDHLHIAGQEPRKRPVTAIVCTRGRRRVPTCQEPGCDRSRTKLCDYPVTRKGKPGTCDRKICDGHAVAQGPDRDFCQAHARMVKLREKQFPTPPRQLTLGLKDES